jgi:phosphoglycolate phosphatase-like HAD superfamily hydrolase
MKSMMEFGILGVQTAATLLAEEKQYIKPWEGRVKIIQSEQLICVDVDDTLIIHRKAKKSDTIVCFTDPYDKAQRYVTVHKPHVKILKDRKRRGATIVVWSQSGYKWAEAVVKALQLQDYVDYVASKPVAIIDDKPASDWLAERIYLDPNSKYGQL